MATRTQELSSSPSPPVASALSIVKDFHQSEGGKYMKAQGKLEDFYTLGEKKSEKELFRRYMKH